MWQGCGCGRQASPSCRHLRDSPDMDRKCHLHHSCCQCVQIWRRIFCRRGAAIGAVGMDCVWQQIEALASRASSSSAFAFEKGHTVSHCFAIVVAHAAASHSLHYFPFCRLFTHVIVMVFSLRCASGAAALGIPCLKMMYYHIDLCQATLGLRRRGPITSCEWGFCH